MANDIPSLDNQKRNMKKKSKRGRAKKLKTRTNFRSNRNAKKTGKGTFHERRNEAAVGDLTWFDASHHPTYTSPEHTHMKKERKSRGSREQISHTYTYIFYIPPRVGLAIRSQIFIFFFKKKNKKFEYFFLRERRGTGASMMFVSQKEKKTLLQEKKGIQ